jgi:O-methyltransferase
MRAVDLDANSAVNIGVKMSVKPLPVSMSKTSFSTPKRLILSTIRRFGYEVFKAPTVTEREHETITPLASYAPWNLDPVFAKVYDQCRANTLVDIYRCFEIWSSVAEAAKLKEGDLLEVGVWRGGSGAIIAAQSERLMPSAQLFLCDTFTGVVKTGAQDTIYADGMHADTSPEIVQRLLAQLAVKNTSLLQGIFPERTGDWIKDRKFRFCHIDVDVYQSAKDTCEWLWPRLVSGGLVLLDDYGMLRTGGVQCFVDEWRGRNDLTFIYNLNGHAIFIKK